MKTKESLLPSILVVAIGTGVLLLIPLIAMQFTDEVVWTISDFVIMALLLFSTGLSFKLLTRSSGCMIQRIASGFALASTFFLIWANLAVGLIGAGPNAGNLMYIGVLFVGVVASVYSRFRPAGMATAMFAMVGALVILTLIALITGMQHYPASSVGEILRVNGFFAILFLASGLLFRLAAKKDR